MPRKALQVLRTPELRGSVRTSGNFNFRVSEGYQVPDFNKLYIAGYGLDDKENEAPDRSSPGFDNVGFENETPDRSSPRFNEAPDGNSPRFDNLGLVKHAERVRDVLIKAAVRLSKDTSWTKSGTNLSAFMFLAFEVYVPRQGEVGMQKLYTVRRTEWKQYSYHWGYSKPPKNSEAPLISDWHFLAALFNRDEVVRNSLRAYKGLFLLARDEELLDCLKSHPFVNDESAKTLALRLGALTNAEFNRWRQRVLSMEEGKLHCTNIFPHQYMKGEDKEAKKGLPVKTKRRVVGKKAANGNKNFVVTPSEVETMRQKTELIFNALNGSDMPRSIRRASSELLVFFENFDGRTNAHSPNMPDGDALPAATTTEDGEGPSDECEDKSAVMKSRAMDQGREVRSRRSLRVLQRKAKQTSKR